MAPTLPSRHLVGVLSFGQMVVHHFLNKDIHTAPFITTLPCWALNHINHLTSHLANLTQVFKVFR